MKFVIAFDNLLEKISKWGLITCLFGILTLAMSAIILRWLGESLMWVEPLTRHLVFLSAFLGGSLATSKGVHIKVDVLTKLLDRSSSKLLHWSHRNLITLFCFLTCSALFKAAWDFFLVEREFGAPSFLNIHSSWLVAIIFVGIGLIALRFFNQLFLGIFHGEQRDHHSL